jgi:hypothetical protein
LTEAEELLSIDGIIKSAENKVLATKLILMVEKHKEDFLNNLYKTHWEIIWEDDRWLGKYKKAFINNDLCYRITIRSIGRWFRPQEYVVTLMPYEITYYDGPNNVTIPNEYEFGNDDVMYFEYFGNMVSHVGRNTDIAYIADDDDVKLLEYDFGGSEITQTLDTEKEAEDLAVTIMESGDWQSDRPALENLPSEYRQSPYPT